LGGSVVLAVAALSLHLFGHKGGLKPGFFWQPAALMAATAAWMIWSSRVGKLGMIRSLLDGHDWHGTETVLDIGAGRGLAAIACAQRVPSGRVVGIDLWRGSDLSGNGPDAAKANVEAAGVASRVSFETGDATTLPYADGTFDVVVSTTALHNIASAAGRRRAVEEAMRVVRPGGTVLIFDIIHTRSYAEVARRAGARRVRLSRLFLLWALPGWFMVAEKGASPMAHAAA